jgi:hypothetical protein
MYDYHSRSHSPRSPTLARAVGRSSAVSPLPPSWTPPASLPRTGLDACTTLKPLAVFFKGTATPPFVMVLHLAHRWLTWIDKLQLDRGLTENADDGGLFATALDAVIVWGVGDATHKAT